MSTSGAVFQQFNQYEWEARPALHKAKLAGIGWMRDDFHGWKAFLASAQQVMGKETMYVDSGFEVLDRIVLRLSGNIKLLDIVRRNAGQIAEEVLAALRERFVRGARDNGVDDEAAAAAFDQIEAFAGFGFCKSHAAAFALVVGMLGVPMVGDLLALLELSDRNKPVVAINSMIRSPQDELSEGAVVNVFQAVYGG